MQATRAAELMWQALLQCTRGCVQWCGPPAAASALAHTHYRTDLHVRTLHIEHIHNETASACWFKLEQGQNWDGVGMALGVRWGKTMTALVHSVYR